MGKVLISVIVNGRLHTLVRDSLLHFYCLNCNLCVVAIQKGKTALQHKDKKQNKNKVEM